MWGDWEGGLEKGLGWIGVRERGVGGEDWRVYWCRGRGLVGRIGRGLVWGLRGDWKGELMG